MKRTIISLTVLASTVVLQTMHGSVLFENSVLFNFQASGPVSLMTGQNVSACATNVDNSPVAVLIALFQADNGSLLAVRQQTLQPGGGACLNYVRTPQPNAVAQNGNVIGLVVPKGRLNELGAIVQDRPGGGGCIAASLQVQAVNLNNTAGQTFLYVPLKEFDETGRRDN